MIKVEVRRIDKSTSNDIVESFDTVIANTFAEAIADGLREETANMECKKHPGIDSILLVEAVAGDNSNIDKSGFCCKEFADTIQVSFKGKSE
jgi:hypothetical protein